MKATFISRENNDVKFTMEFTAEEFENAQIKAYQAAKDQFQIDGFRKGKAPRSIIEKHYGEGVFFEEAIDQLFRESYGEALKELDLEVVDAPAAEFSKIAKGEGFTITITVPCFPIIAVKDYQGVEIEKVSQEVKDEDIDNELKALQKRNARMILVERPAQDGDTVLLDYSGFVGDEQFEGGTAERQELTLGSGMFIPGFEEQLVGATPGEKRDVTVTFPAEYHAEELAGKEATFKCKVHKVEETILPEIDDEFAKDVSDTCETLDDLKKEITERLKAERQEAADNAFEEKVLDAVIDGMKADIPAAMIDAQVDTIVQDFGYRLQMQGMGLEQYLKMTGTEMGAFRAMFKDQAERQVKTRLALQKVVELEGITVSDKELEEEYAKMAEQYKMEVEKVKAIVSKEALEGDLKISNALEFIKKNAKVKKAAKKKAAEETAE